MLDRRKRLERRLFWTWCCSCGRLVSGHGPAYQATEGTAMGGLIRRHVYAPRRGGSLARKMSENNTESGVGNTDLAVTVPKAKVAADGTFFYDFSWGPSVGDESPIGVDWIASHLMLLTDELLLQANRHGSIRNLRLAVKECYRYNDGIDRMWISVRLSAQEEIGEPRSPCCHRQPAGSP